MKTLIISSVITLIILIIVAMTGSWMLLILWSAGWVLHRAVTEWTSFFSSVYGKSGDTPTYTFTNNKNQFDRR